MCHFKRSRISQHLFGAFAVIPDQQREFHLRSSAQGQKLHSITHFGPLPETPAIPRISPATEALKLTSSSVHAWLSNKGQFSDRKGKTSTWLWRSAFVTLGAFLPTLTQPILLYLVCEVHDVRPSDLGASRKYWSVDAMNFTQFMRN